MDKLIEFFWYYWVYYVICLKNFLTDISNKWFWRNNISWFTFSKIQFNMNFCFCKASNVIYSKAFYLRSNSSLNILALKNLKFYYSPDTLFEGWTLTLDGSTLGLEGWTLAFEGWTLAFEGWTLGLEGWTPYLTDGHPTWRMDTILDGRSLYLTDEYFIFMNCLYV